MKKNSAKKLYTVLVIILLLSTVNALLVTCQGIGGLIYPECFGVRWLDAYKWLQVAIIVGRMIGGLALSALLYIFTINTIKGYKAGVLFPRKNFGVLIACSIALFVYIFCQDNIHLVRLSNDAVGKLYINPDTIVFPLIFVVFALMYKVAVKVSEENSLTI